MLKNPFKRLNDLEDRIADLENKNLADKLHLLKTSIENDKKTWELNNPPIFKQGEVVEVFKRIAGLPDNPTKTLYSGKIVCVLRTNNDYLYSNRLKVSYCYIYCIDASDFKFHEAPESLIRKTE